MYESQALRVWKYFTGAEFKARLSCIRPVIQLKHNNMIDEAPETPAEETPEAETPAPEATE